MQTDFKVRDRQPVTVISQRVSVRLANIGAVISAGFGQAYGFLGADGAAASEPPFIVYHGSPGAADRPFEIEICVPIAGIIEPPSGWVVTELPAGTFASVMHVGPYDTLGTAYDELESWIARQGFAIAGPPREVYLSEPATPAEDIRTVIEFPVVASKSAVPVASS